jgi:tRNA (mo5U34)-methyltransferase
VAFAVIDGAVVESVFWWHSIDLGDRVTPGHKSPELLEQEWANLDLPDLAAKSVLDIGAWDGWFSFRAETEGAARVVALDHYVWSLDLRRQQAYWRTCRDRGVPPQPYHERRDLWQPDSLPGKAGFDLAHARRHSHVEALVGDFMTTDLDALGTFDVVLFLGVLYHLEEPLTALRRLRKVTASLAVIESEAVVIDGATGPLLRFVPDAEVNADSSNWWIPTEAALHALCRAAGFRHVRTTVGPGKGVERYRLVVHASV